MMIFSFNVSDGFDMNIAAYCILFYCEQDEQQNTIKLPRNSLQTQNFFA